MKIRITIALIVLSFHSHGQNLKDLNIMPFRGDQLAENAYLIRGKGGFTLIDAIGSETAARQILSATTGLKLNTIFITHGHPDHFLGLATIISQHPEAVIFVASEEIKEDIIRYADFAAAKGLMDATPLMKPRSKVPTGFDYQQIKILPTPKLAIDKSTHLNVRIMPRSAECAHNTILYSDDQRLLFASDLLYNKVFNWMGAGVDQVAIKNWIAIIEGLKNQTDKEVTIYPGHGTTSDYSLFDNNINYLQTFQNILCRTTSDTDAKAFFKQIYNDYEGDFLLTRSINQWIDSCTERRSGISINNIQDLTHTLTPDFPYIPVPGITFPFELKSIATLEQHGVRANQWMIHEHLGTQIDAPNHFAKNGIALNEIDIKELIVPIVVIDISEKCIENPDATLTVADIQSWETENGRIPDRACVMMYSGWEKFLYTEKYLGLTKEHVKHFPGISLEAIGFLIKERGITGVGVDVISIDPGYDHEYKGHKLLLSTNKWALEAVANLKLIPKKGAWLFVGAPKIGGATGGIVRLLAVW